MRGGSCNFQGPGIPQFHVQYGRFDRRSNIFPQPPGFLLYGNYSFDTKLVEGTGYFATLRNNRRYQCGLAINLKTILALLLLVPVCASATPTSAIGLGGFKEVSGFKEMVVTAITEGKSSGYMDSESSKYFTLQTKSKEPVQVYMERTKKLSDRCAELLIVTMQPGVPMKDGKEPGVSVVKFNLPICLDGSYPEMLKSLDDERKKREVAQCQPKIKQGAMGNDGMLMDASIDFKDCPANGVVGIFYDGTCKELGPGPTAVVKEFDFDKEGKLSIKMRIPKTCLAASARNKWQLYIFERLDHKAAKVLAGTKTVFW